MFDLLEQFQYEMRPYVYAALSGFSFYNASYSKLLVMSGALLAFCTFVVASMRYQSRNTIKVPVQKPKIRR